MRSRLLSTLAALAITLGLGAGAQAQLMYSFESPAVNPDGFGPNGGGVTVAQDVIGATESTHSLRYSVVTGATFVGALTGNVPAPLNDPNFSSVSFDMTIPNVGTDPGPFTGAFAVLGVTIFGASQPGPSQQFGIQFQASSIAHIEGKTPGTYHITLDPLVGTNPLTFDTNQSYSQVFGSGPNQLIPTGFQFFINKSNDAPVTVYLDNVVAIVPEPASLSLLGLSSLLLLRRRMI